MKIYVNSQLTCTGDATATQTKVKMVQTHLKEKPQLSGTVTAHSSTEQQKDTTLFSLKAKLPLTNKTFLILMICIHNVIKTCTFIAIFIAIFIDNQSL